MTRTLWGLPDIEFKFEEPVCDACKYCALIAADDEEFYVCAAVGWLILPDIKSRHRECPLRKVERTLDEVMKNRRGQFL